MTVQADIQNIERRVGIFLTAHHIMLYLLLAAGGLFGVYAIESKWVAIETARADAAQQALAAEKDHSTQLAAAYATAQAQRDKENAQFLQTISQLQAATKVQIVHDTQLPAPDLGHRIETLTGFKQDTVSLNSSDDLIVPLPLGRQIVTMLDQGQVDAQTVTQQAGVIKNQAATIADQAGIIAEDKKVLAAQIDSDAKVLNEEKAKGRKSKLKWFAIGVAVGWIGREFSKF